MMDEGVIEMVEDKDTTAEQQIAVVEPPKEDEAGQQLEEQDRLGKQSVEVVQTLAQKVSDEARRINGGQPQELNWDMWSVANLEPRQPLYVGDLKAEFPELAEALLQPLEKYWVGDATRIRSFGYWRNPSSYSAVKFTVENAGDTPRTIRRVYLEASIFPETSWENIPLKPHSRDYYPVSGEFAAFKRFISVLEQANQLVDKVIQEGGHSANYTSHTERIGQEFWEKEK